MAKQKAPTIEVDDAEVQRAAAFQCYARFESVNPAQNAIALTSLYGNAHMDFRRLRHAIRDGTLDSAVVVQRHRWPDSV